MAKSAGDVAARMAARAARKYISITRSAYSSLRSAQLLHAPDTTAPLAKAREGGDGRLQTEAREFRLGSRRKALRFRFADIVSAEEEAAVWIVLARDLRINRQLLEQHKAHPLSRMLAEVPGPRDNQDENAGRRSG